MASAFGASSGPSDQEVGSGRSPNPQTSRRPVRDARAALAAGDARRALAMLDSTVPRLSPAERLSVEGRAHLLLGNHALARRKLEEAVHLRPKHPADLYWLGRAYAACGAPALAASRFQEANWNGLDTAEVHYHWAVALESLGKLLGTLSRRQWPDDAEYPATPGSFIPGGLVVGPAPDRPGSVIVCPPNSALYQIHRALESEPHWGQALLSGGQIWAAANRHRQAVSLFVRAARYLEGEDLVARCHESWADSLLALGDLDGYLAQARQRIRLSDNIDSAHLARCYDRAARQAAQRGDLRRQIRYLTFAVELEPAVHRLITLADALLQAQRSGDAHRHLQTALEQNPSRQQRRQILSQLQRTTHLASPR
jgi:tetratricopeptide (TPR) repeat protein